MMMFHEVVIRFLKPVVLIAGLAAVLGACGGSSGSGEGADLEDDDSNGPVDTDGSEVDLESLLDVSASSTVFKSTDLGYHHNFGKVVLSSADGQTIAIAEPVEYGFNKRIGVVFIYEHGAEGWTRSGAVFDTDAVLFGDAAALTPDGRRLVVGAPYTSLDSYIDPVMGRVTGVSAGKLFIYDKTDSGEWEEVQQVVVEQPLSQEKFAESVDISDDGKTIVAGASGRSCPRVVTEADKEQCVDGSGAIYFITEQADGSWATPQRVRPESIGEDFSFGRRLSMNADASTVAITIGGLLTVWQRDSRGSFQREAIIEPVEDNDLIKSFGASLALTADGNTLLVGSTYATYSEAAYTVNVGPYSTPYTGIVTVYERENGLWSAVQQIRPPVSRDYWARFGSAIATTPDGARIAIGMNYANSLLYPDSNNAGAAFVFDRIGDAYEAIAWAQPTHYATSRFGTTLALSSDGRQLVGGAPNGSMPGSGINPAEDAESQVASGDAYVLQLPR